MKSLTILFLFSILFNANMHAQNNASFERKGFIFGAAIGISSVSLKYPSQPTQNEISASLPNFKIGTMISNRTAVVVYLPGSIYTYEGSGRNRDRGFEAIIPSVQYWLKDRWWILGGAGLGMDAPAFYDIKNEEERKFYFGSSVIAATGYEIWRKEKFTLDIQGRVHYGSANVSEGTRNGMAYNLLVGFNWY
ncbi:MAG: hypothetical protein H7Y00_05700 [Fimbriimonadaceae bacterium]|nr:hypothetical protein [Chitinophagales bacterium]